MNKIYKINHATENGTQTIYCKYAIIPIEDVFLYANNCKMNALCKVGCVNYGNKWSCPPYSSSINKIISECEYKTAILLCEYIYMTDMKYIKNSYQQVKAANAILKSSCEKISRKLEESLDGYALLSGSCNLCKPCHKKKNEPCKNPDKMRYSMESTGLDVQALLEEYCDHKLLWYKKGEVLPYTSVANLVLTPRLGLTELELFPK